MALCLLGLTLAAVHGTGLPGWRGDLKVTEVDQGPVPPTPWTLEPLELEFVPLDEPLKQYCTHALIEGVYGAGGQAFVLKAVCTLENETLAAAYPPPCRPDDDGKDGSSQSECMPLTVAVKIFKWWRGGYCGKKGRKELTWRSWGSTIRNAKHDSDVYQALQRANQFTQRHAAKDFLVPGHRNVLRLVGKVRVPIGLLNSDALKEMKKYMSDCMAPQALRRALAEWGELHEFQGLVYESTGYPASLSDFMRGRKVSLDSKDEVAANMRDVLRGIARGLQFLHSQNMIHNDLGVAGKNVFLKRDSQGLTGVVHDLGYARHFVGESAETDKIRCLAKATELYHFGDLLYEMCYAHRLPEDRGQPHTGDGYTGEYIRAYMGDHDSLHPFDEEKYVCNPRQRLLMHSMMETVWAPALAYVAGKRDSGVFANGGDEVVDSIWDHLLGTLEDLKEDFF